MYATLRLTCGIVGGISNVPTVSVLCGEAKTITVGIQIVIIFSRAVHCITPKLPLATH